MESKYEELKKENETHKNQLDEANQKCEYIQQEAERANNELREMTETEFNKFRD